VTRESGALLSTYTVDAEDRILSVSGRWVAFARENGAPELDARTVLGRSLWDFVAGEEIRSLYRAVFARVRSLDVPILLPFRCDSPGLRRYMRLVVSPLRDGRLRIDAVPVREEVRRHLVLLEASADRGGTPVPMCDQCKRILTPGGEWLEPEDAAVRMRLLASDPVPDLAHGVCPRCGDLFGESLRSGGAA
jgi:hypothetical protein